MLYVAGFTAACKLFHLLVTRPGNLVRRVFPDKIGRTVVSGDSGTMAVWTQIFKEHTYFQHGLSLPKDRNAPITVIDLGSNLGFFSQSVASEYPNATLHCVEPIPLLMNAVKNNLKEVKKNHQFHFHNVAIADHETPAEIDLKFDPAMTSSTSAFNQNNSGVTVPQLLSAITSDLVRSGDWIPVVGNTFSALLKVPVLQYLMVLLLVPWGLFSLMKISPRSIKCKTETLSSLLRKAEGGKVAKTRIDFLKVDVEGAEWAALCGIDDCDWERVDQVVVEVQFKGNVGKIEALLKRKGFKHIHTEFEDWELLKLMDIYNIYAKRQ